MVGDHSPAVDRPIFILLFRTISVSMHSYVTYHLCSLTNIVSLSASGVLFSIPIHFPVFDGQ
jgi:hypothetical protein